MITPARTILIPEPTLFISQRCLEFLTVLLSLEITLKRLPNINSSARTEHARALHPHAMLCRHGKSNRKYSGPSARQSTIGSIHAESLQARPHSSAHGSTSHQRAPSARALPLLPNR